MDLSDFRKQYTKGELLESEAPPNPITLFADWFDEVQSHGKEQETNAMTLSVQHLDGGIASRVVLLKGVSDEGFVFYTNYNSSKGKSIAQNNQVCLSFFWQSLERQVIVRGKATKLPATVSDNYFQSRPRGSQLGALVSNQSQVIDSRATIEKRLQLLTDQYKHQTIPRPSHWGGYLVSPHSVEFWQGRANRLHDRLEYQRNSSIWAIKRLSP